MLGPLEAVLFSPSRRTALAARGGLLVAGGLTAGLLVAALGPIYALVGFIAAVGGLFILRDVRWGMAALCAVVGLLPFAALPFKLGFTPTFLDLALLALYFVWIMRIATRRQEELVGTPLGLAVLAFTALAVFAFANGLRYSQPTATTIRNFLELLLGILSFFLIANNFRTERDHRLVAGLFILAGAAAAAIAIVFYLLPPATTVRVLDALGRLNYPGGYGALRYIEDDPANPMRAIGTMVDPNVLGGFMILVAGLTAPQVVSPTPLWRRRWLALILVLDLLALYLTYSRGSLVGLAAGLLAVGLLRYRKLLLIALIGAGLLMLLPPAQAYVAHFIEGIQLQDRATLMRLGEYKDALALIGRYPWLGVGFAGSPDANLYVGVSNLYLLIAEEMGVIGAAWFLATVGLFLGHLWTAWRKARRLASPQPQREALLLGIGAAVVGVLVGGIFDHYLFNLVYPHMSTTFWMYLGLGMAVAQAGDVA
ncbi:MAG: O-antigen ligase family protein [Anaerolineae bacterium]